VYVGTYLTREVTKCLLPALAKLTGLQPLWPVPKGVEVVRRQDAKKQLWFFINHNDEPVKLKTPAGKPATLKPNDVLIVRR
jgi:beta-galactosidase GanA